MQWAPVPAYLSKMQWKRGVRQQGLIFLGAVLTALGYSWNLFRHNGSIF